MLIPVILSGGAGTRLWPVSREGNPKPFMKVDQDESLLLKTYKRAASAAAGPEIMTVTNRDYFFMSKDEFQRGKFSADESPVFMLEPMGRNTAPAVAMAALQVAEKHGSDAMLLVLAADHLIADQAKFEAAVGHAAELASTGHLVTFGIVPTGPETGFGYIEAGETIGGGRRVVRFVEKPSQEKAQEYLATGNFLWNSGMFCFKAGLLLEEMTRHAPEVVAASKACWQEMRKHSEISSSMFEIPADLFVQVPDISIDYAVMEHSEKVAVVPADFDWNDIGSWSALRDLHLPDAENNRSNGESIFVETRNTFVQSSDRLIATVGVDDLMIIDTPDALLVAHTDRSQEVKQVVQRLKLANHDAYKLHRTVSRPWGTYTVLEHGPRFKIKRIEVRPGRSLSLQMHHHRSEHWVVVSGMAKVTNGDKELFINTNESTYIPAGHKHRLENPGIVDLVMIEVQSGEYLGEDDIVRYEDAYGRFTGEKD